MRCGVDIGGTKVLGALVDGSGDVVRSVRVPTPKQEDALVETIVEVVRELSGGEALDGIGVGIAGLVTRDGTVRYSPNIPDVIELPLAELLSRNLGTRVVVENDANAAMWAESHLGAARGHHDAVLATLGTGIGVGIVSGGRLIRGAHGFAGEAGHFTVDPNGPVHVTGKRGPWELFGSGHALGRLARARAAEGRFDAGIRLAGSVEAIRGEHVQAALAEGDARALELVRDFAVHVARGVATLVYVLDPELAVLGGGVVRMGEPLRAAVEDAVADELVGSQYRPRVRVELAAMGVEATAVGAALLSAGDSLTP